MEKTISLQCGHVISWHEWGEDEDFPVPGMKVYCNQCRAGQIVKYVDPMHYTHRPGQLITVDEGDSYRWVVPIDEFGGDLDLFCDWLMEAANPDEYAIYGDTVFATDSAVQAAIAAYCV